MLKPVRLEELLQAPRQQMTLPFKQNLEGFESLTPVEGEVNLVHCGTFLEVSGHAQTIVTLTCHRCLQQFNHRFQVELEEVLWIEEPDPVEPAEELELLAEDLLERIPPRGAFDPADWLYQHLYLQLPDRLACRPDCTGIEIAPIDAPPDPRWAALRILKQSQD